MIKFLALTLLASSTLITTGCEDYPHNEPCLTQCDLHKSGNGSYGGESTPASPATQKSDAGKF